MTYLLPVINFYHFNSPTANCKCCVFDHEVLNLAKCKERAEKYCKLIRSVKK